MLLEHVENYTPFEYFAFEKMGPGRHHHDVLIAKASCALHPSSSRGSDTEGIRLLAEAAPIHMADEHHGEPEHTGLRLTSDTVLIKPGADLWFRGSAVPPPDRRTHWAAQISLIGRKQQRTHKLRLTGPRHWQWSLAKGWHLCEPQPVDRLPLRYELAFGGRYARKGQWLAHPDNPVGVGFLDPDRLDREAFYPAPQLECLEHPAQRPGKPVPVPGLGPLPRFWASRKRHAGTYDAAWRAQFESQKGADYPSDFDLRFFQAAHPDWTFDHPLEGNEKIEIAGLHGDRVCIGQLPALRLEALLQPAAGAAVVAPLRLDTLEIDLDASRLYLTWRITITHRIAVRHAVLRVFKMR